MAKKAVSKTAAEKKFADVLDSLEDVRKKSGCQLSNEQLEFIVKLVKASA